VPERENANRTREAGNRDKVEGAIAIVLAFVRSGAVGFIDWLDGFIDIQAHVLNAFATAVSNDIMTISLIARAEQQLNFKLA